jgi:hypothetical protein
VTTADRAGHGEGVASGSAPWLERLDVIEERLAEAADRVALDGLTEADATTGERWEGGQVWAHLAEFVPYWIAETLRVIDPDETVPVPFGRVKSDEGRLSAIETRRHDPIGALAEKTIGDAAALRELLERIDGDAAAWARMGLHPKLGEMTMEAIFEDFLVGHLEEHLGQLDGLDRDDARER